MRASDKVRGIWVPEEPLKATSVLWDGDIFRYQVLTDWNFNPGSPCTYPNDLGKFSRLSKSQFPLL